MPLYTYTCPHGDTTDVLTSYEKRPEVVFCEKCGQAARQTIALPAKTEYLWGSFAETYKPRNKGN